MTFSFTDHDGDRLQVVPSRDGAAANLLSTAPDGGRPVCVTVRAWRLPDLVAAMYEAAGETVPVMIHPDRVADGWVHLPRKAGAA